jgi:hypothetical protein
MEERTEFSLFKFSPDDYFTDFTFCGSTQCAIVLNSNRGYIHLLSDSKLKVIKRVCEKSLGTRVHFYEDFFPYNNNIYCHVWRIGLELNLFTDEYSEKRKKLLQIFKFLNVEYKLDFDFSNKAGLVSTEDFDKCIFIVPACLERFYTLEQNNRHHNKTCFDTKTVSLSL